MVVSIYNNMRVVAVRLQTVRAPEFAGKHTDVDGHRVGLLSQVGISVSKISQYHRLRCQPQGAKGAVGYGGRM